MGFRKKIGRLLELNPDIAVVAECSKAALDEVKDQVASGIWIGDNPRKGLGVFSFGDFKLTLASVYADAIPYIAPTQVRGPVCFNLLAVWACHSKEHSWVDGLGPLCRAIESYQAFMHERATVVAGDFNDNVRWDRPRRLNNHGANFKALNALGLVSAYHHHRNVSQGCEPEPTIYWRNRTVDGPRYHIDYCFLPDTWAPAISGVTVGWFEDWVATKASDHVPLIVDVDI